MASTDSSGSSSSVRFAPSNEYAEAPSEPDVEAEGLPSPSNDGAVDPNAPHQAVRLTWNQPFEHSLSVVTSLDGFTSALELQGDSEQGWSVEVSAPTGQDLLYRFAVDGEWATNGSEPIIQLNGDEFNVMAVADEASAGASAAADESSDKVSTPPRKSSVAGDAPPNFHRRQSSKLVSVLKHACFGRVCIVSLEC
jgi:hypothetical protein